MMAKLVNRCQIIAYVITEISVAISATKTVQHSDTFKVVRHSSVIIRRFECSVVL